MIPTFVAASGVGCLRKSVRVFSKSPCKSLSLMGGKLCHPTGPNTEFPSCSSNRKLFFSKEAQATWWLHLPLRLELHHITLTVHPLYDKSPSFTFRNCDINANGWLETSARRNKILCKSTSGSSFVNLCSAKASATGELQKRNIFSQLLGIEERLQPEP